MSDTLTIARTSSHFEIRYIKRNWINPNGKPVALRFPESTSLDYLHDAAEQIDGSVYRVTTTEERA